VQLTAVIGRDGTVLSLSVVSGHPMLVQAALQAVRQWRYAPTLLNGDPVEVISPIVVSFSLNR
jgi:protein TonB